MNALLLVPHTQIFQLDYLELSVREIVLEMTSTQIQSKCPDCGTVSFHIHSLHPRTLADLPWAGRRIILHLHLHRFFCDNPNCPRVTFVERLPEVAVPYARRTQRLAEALCQIGFVLGGEAGTRLAHKQGMPTSADTLLRLVRSSSDPDFSPPRILGVDDWAWRKGQTYGTILVDLEKQRIIDLLPDRSAETLAKWLKQYPSIELVTRDRSTGYLEGVTQGAPQAIQVADRFHLLKNLRETVEKGLTRHQQIIHQMRKTEAAHPSEKREEVVIEPAPKLDRPFTQAEQKQQAMYEKHKTQLEEVQKLHQQGISIREIHRMTRMSREKVRRLLLSDVVPMYHRRKTPSILDPYWAYIQKRWEEGCRNGVDLYHELQEKGYSGCYGNLSRRLPALRQQMPRQPKQPRQKPLQGRRPSTPPPLSPKQVAWWFLKSPDELEPDQTADLERLFLKSEEIHRSYNLTREFTKMVRERKPDQFDPWLHQAEASNLVDFRNFSKGLQRDYAAVRASLCYSWSNGPVEGHNNRLKMVKREMFGRAKFDLLRSRVLYTG